MGVHKRTVGFLGLALCLSLGWGNALAHGGGLDDNGGHTDSSTGNYHCHQQPCSQSGQGGSNGASGSSASSSGRSSNGSSAPSNVSSDYDRDDWHSGWADLDGDCQDVREEVLIQESEIPVEFETARECNVVSGRWEDPYSGKTFTDPSELHIDHLVPLKEAHVSGGSSWDGQRRHKYANHLASENTLIAVSASENMSKSASDPADWMPSNEAYHCDYIRDWVSVKNRWGMSADRAERQAIDQYRQRCR